MSMLHPRQTGALLCLTSAAVVGSLLYSCKPASAQTLDAAAGAQAVAIVGGGGGSSSDTQTLRTNPDLSAPPAMTTHFSCYVGEGGVAIGSYLFGGVSATRTMLDEGCEARADVEAYIALATVRAELFGDDDGALRNLMIAEKRMTSTREDFVAAWPGVGGRWEDLWRP